MQAIRATRPGGHVGYVGVAHDVQLPGDELFFSDVHLHGGPAPVRRFLPELIELIWNRRDRPRQGLRPHPAARPGRRGLPGHGRAPRHQGRCCSPDRPTEPKRTPWSHPKPTPTGKGPADWFTGDVYIDPIRNPDEQSAVGCAHVHFTPGARTAWHRHPIGQTLFVTDGVGLVPARGGQRPGIRPGDVVRIEPGEEHWHGATPTSS